MINPNAKIPKTEKSAITRTRNVIFFSSYSCTRVIMIRANDSRTLMINKKIRKGFIEFQIDLTNFLDSLIVILSALKIITRI